MPPETKSAQLRGVELGARALLAHMMPGGKPAPQIAPFGETGGTTDTNDAICLVMT